MRRGQVTGLWRWVLSISVFVNILVLGVVLGSTLMPDDRRPPPVAMGGTGPFSQALSHEQRRSFAAMMREEMRGIAPDRAHLRGQIAQIRTLLGAETLDTTALEALFAAQRQMGAALQQQADRSLVAYLAQLDRAARQEIAARLGRGPRGG